MSRLKPHFFIIGERKCGTSSLYRYLLQHPLILPGPRKEMQFFSQGEQKIADGFENYLSEFPLAQSDEESHLEWPELDPHGILFHEHLRFQRQANTRYVTGEASADTFCEVAPQLLKSYLPDLRLLMLLRDPVERAFSHHRMFTRFQEEGRELGFEVGDFSTDMRLEMKAIERGGIAPCLSPGLYAQPLRKWIDVWGEESILVLFSEDLAIPEQCQQTMQRVLKHLRLPQHNYGGSLANRYNEAPQLPIPTSIAAELRDFFRPDGVQLRSLLNRNLPWLPISAKKEP